MRTGRIVAMACLVPVLAGCGVMEQISLGAYKTAVVDGAVADLAKLGITMDGRPDCRTSDAGSPGSGSPEVLRIECTGRTTGGELVIIKGDVTNADSADPREAYEITVGGRVVLRGNCLGLGCKER